ncbi:hypothetical protein [Corynebacterium argentoratense]|uniref:hypothetical protein n=1 Tax=Corynebacterium argentoratense TaxID=42817 RepID=UPI001F403819|nr:hypothetical protein [Corynebacterium argentoratense]MCF1712112.1 hypothetical protein [Corynebacterium argentoratense]
MSSVIADEYDRTDTAYSVVDLGLGLADDVSLTDLTSWQQQVLVDTWQPGEQDLADFDPVVHSIIGDSGKPGFSTFLSVNLEKLSVQRFPVLFTNYSMVYQQPYGLGEGKFEVLGGDGKFYLVHTSLDFLPHGMYE